MEKNLKNNFVILEVAGDNKALRGAVTDRDKAAKVWEKVGVTNISGAHRRLGGSGEVGSRGGTGDTNN